MRPLWFFVITAAIFGIMIVAAFLSGEPEFALPVALVALIVLAYFAFTRVVAHQALKKHGNNVEAAMSDAADPVPAAPFISDDETALGDTREAHAEINPHDFPKGAPERAEVERMAALEDGTTSGHADPADRAGRTANPTGKAEGYPAGEPRSAPRGRS